MDDPDRLLTPGALVEPEGPKAPKPYAATENEAEVGTSSETVSEGDSVVYSATPPGTILVYESKIEGGGTMHDQYPAELSTRKSSEGHRDLQFQWL
jgi:hypothetical protein